MGERKAVSAVIDDGGDHENSTRRLAAHFSAAGFLPLHSSYIYCRGKARHCALSGNAGGAQGFIVYVYLAIYWLALTGEVPISIFHTANKARDISLEGNWSPTDLL